MHAHDLERVLRHDVVARIGATARSNRHCVHLSEAAKHLVRGSLACQVVICPVLRVDAEPILDIVKVVVQQIITAALRINKLVLVEALQEVHSVDKINVDLCQKVAICVLLDVPTRELFNDHPLAEEVADVTLEQHVAHNEISLVLPSHRGSDSMLSLELLQFFGENVAIVGHVEELLHGGLRARQKFAHVRDCLLVGLNRTCLRGLTHSL